ncbi:hypothetical protein FRACA_1440016 [Frankia canadensis]|uniref:Uncharacterized protein n=1 Tax=Frankia canadensis TaxID=1836972 RepID=A0A2I2KLL0_9ACTN|nr:hypothetical protein FRACA_1440016 [Frankia canadensis]SOU53842.1 hypothetical protein FRACA_1440016 [Frankia canadensis]
MAAFRQCRGGPCRELWGKPDTKPRLRDTEPLPPARPSHRWEVRPKCRLRETVDPGADHGVEPHGLFSSTWNARSAQTVGRLSLMTAINGATEDYISGGDG